MPSQSTHPQRPSRAHEHASTPLDLARSAQDEGDFTRRVTPHLPFLTKIARDILGSEDLAWDAVQETLLRLWARGYVPEDARGPLAYLVRKSSLHLMRCQRRRSFHEQENDASLHLAGHGELCCEDDPLAQVDEAEQASIVREEIAGLARRYRAVLELHALEGHSYETIAEQLEVPVGTVRSRLNRGRSLLRARLSERFSAA